MKIITNSKQLKRRFKNPAVTVGIFDGVHLGHKKIFKEVSKEARRLNGTSVAVTFDPHPKSVLDIIGAPPLLVSLRHRLALMEKEGLDAAVVLDFNKTLAEHSAAEFIKRVLVDRIGARAVIIGEDFRFGRNKEGGIDLLRKLGERYGFLTRGVGLHKIKSRPVSSSRIRSLIMAGRIGEASRLLGRPVSVLGTVVRGSRRGRRLGLRTANINPHHEAIPPAGVYAVYAIIGKKRYKGALNIGWRPTFNQGSGGLVRWPRHSLGHCVLGRRVRGTGQKKVEPVIEVHIFGFNRDIYGKNIEILFIGRLRGEKRFRDAEGLMKQIKVDEHKARMLL